MQLKQIPSELEETLSIYKANNELKHNHFCYFHSELNYIPKQTFLN